MSKVNNSDRRGDILVLHVRRADDLCESVSVSRPIYPLLHLIGDLLAECGYPVMTSALYRTAQRRTPLSNIRLPKVGVACM